MRISAGQFKGRQLPVAHGARPIPGRLRTSLFSVLLPWMEGARVLDVCAGVGGFGLEALSRGAQHVTLIEQEVDAASALHAWVLRAGCDERATVRCADALGAPWPPGPFDLVFLDPPFGFWQDARGADLMGRARQVLEPDGRLAVKVAAGLAAPVVVGLELVREVVQGNVGYRVYAPVDEAQSEHAKPVKRPEASAD